jgi:hypothetical protein
MRSTKKLVVCAGVTVGIVAALAAWWFLPGRRAEVRLSPFSSRAVDRFCLPEAPTYLQTDPRWSSVRVGGSGEPIRWVGCTLCCLSMALGQYGIILDPPALNTKLRNSHGYTYRGWIRWNAFERVSGGKLRVELPVRPTTQNIDDALAKGDPVLVKVILHSGAQHWVLLVGRDQTDYLIKNPLGDGKTLDKLSSLGSDILAVRLIKRL